jgi:serine/threonine-protein kinase HipA
MGVLEVLPSRGKEIFYFTYDDNWLSSDFARVIDPSIHLYSGPQYAPQNQSNFGIFLDSSPDRWGRVLMQRREAFIARQQDRVPKKLLESDYLLGVYDECRMGGIRFRVNPIGPFVSDDAEFATPPWTSLRELEYASLRIESDGVEVDPLFNKWLNVLFAPGASLGGARPKANVVGERGQLFIAKFPSTRDHVDQGAWEFVLHTLAGRAGIAIPGAMLRRFTSNHHTFLVERFDREANGDRIHFASAMTLLQKSDGDDGASGVSYLDLAEFIKMHGSQPETDLEQLWRRIVFFVCVSNVDDHLRNHAFILRPRGWELSPSYDVNPSEDGDGLKLNISELDNSQDLNLARETARYYNINAARADKIIEDVVTVVRNWRTVATSVGISTSNQSHMERAFRIADGRT